MYLPFILASSYIQALISSHIVTTLWTFFSLPITRVKHQVFSFNNFLLAALLNSVHQHEPNYIRPICENNILSRYSLKYVVTIFSNWVVDWSTKALLLKVILIASLCPKTISTEKIQNLQKV